MPVAKDKSFYLGNSNLPTPDAKFDYEKHPEWVSDLEKCRKNILYFADNFFYIINLDKGRTKIDLHGYQRRILRSLRDNRFVIVLSSRQSGKALALDTPIPTPRGWTTMGQLKDNDTVYNLEGYPCQVTKAHDVMHNRNCYSLTFDNGETITADAEHLWFTQTKQDRFLNRDGSVKNTKDIFRTISDDHRIPKKYDGCIRYENAWHSIKEVKSVDTVPVRCITVDSPDNLYLCGRNYIPTHNTTLMCIFALWMACFFEDQRILVVANKESTAIGIFKRIRLAYEQLPNYLKPGAMEYGKTSMTLGNGSSIGISTTSSDAGRGESCNCLVLDELAFIENNMARDFWKSVYPIISSSKKSKIFIASTPNGTDNLFFELYDGAVKNENGWTAERVDWWDVPGRDEDWKKMTIRSIGSKEIFDQEYNNHFHQSGESAVNDVIFDRLRGDISAPTYIFEDGKYLLWDTYKRENLYVIGVDVSEGIGENASVIQVLDITDLRQIQQVAVYHNQNISPLQFIGKCHEIFQHWGSPPVLIERNNCGAQVVDQLKTTLNYPNIINYGPVIAGTVYNRPGVLAHTNTKYKGVINMRYYLNELNAVKIHDLGTLMELKGFIRYPNGTWAARQGPNNFDDKVMSLMWALIILESELAEKFYDVEYDENHKPLKLKPLDFGLGKYFVDPTKTLINLKDPGAGDALYTCMNPEEAYIAEDEIEILRKDGWGVLNKNI